MDYLLSTLQTVLSIPSPTGFTRKLEEYVCGELTCMGFEPWQTRKGAVLVCLGGEGHPIVLAAHGDTLGGMVAEVLDSGNLRMVPVGGFNPNNGETENLQIWPRLGGAPFSGTLQMADPSTHVNGSYNAQTRKFEDMVVFLDAKTASKEDTLALGIHPGDFISADPRTVITPTGYIKSRFLDDKLSVAMLLDLARQVHEGELQLNRKVYLMITVYEEVGHGCSSGIPEDAETILSVDMGCVGEGLQCSERQVSICAKDSAGPYDFQLTNDLIRCAMENGVDYAVDVYPFYSSDADMAMRAGYDMHHGCIGVGVFASHGYERAHVDGVKAAMTLLEAYLRK